jgi:hypothetical protein
MPDGGMVSARLHITSTLSGEIALLLMTKQITPRYLAVFIKKVQRITRQGG